MNSFSKESDVIALHCPLFPETQGIIYKDTIAKMKDGVIILNNSRGPLIVEQDLLASLIFGACAIALGSIPVFWIYLAFMLLCGLAMPFFNTPSTVLLQEKAVLDYLGRVFGVLGMISSSLMPLGMLVFGPISDFVKIEYLLIGTGALMIVQGMFLIGDKALIEAGKPLVTLESAAVSEPVTETEP